MRVLFRTIGCKLNQYETEGLASAFRNAGFEICDAAANADILLVNTCTVTSKAEQKTRRLIRTLVRENPNALLIVTGCYAEVEKETLRRFFPEAVVLDNKAKNKLTGITKEYSQLSPMHIREMLSEPGMMRNIDDRGPFTFFNGTYNFHVRAFLKIQDGCSRFCSFCRIPFARGGPVSLARDTVLERIRILAGKGFQEIVLTGVNIASYKSGGDDLAALLKQVKNESGSFRIRLSSLEPDLITDSLLHELDDDRICPHFHIPVQSGSGKILSAMKRNYLPETVSGIIEKMRRPGREPFIAFDIIAGFPGESDDDFRKTVELICESTVSYIHAFPFSPRPQTAAFTVNGHIPERIIRERMQALSELSISFNIAYRRKMIGFFRNVLIEKKTGDLYEGLTENYIRVRFKPDKKVTIGSVVRVTLTGIDGIYMSADIEREPLF